MEQITKALQELAKAIENQNAVQGVRISIVLKKSKLNKAKSQDDT